MWITRTSIGHPVFATMVMLALLILGIFSYRELGLEKMPDVQLPSLFIEVQYPGASSEAVENDLTKPIEDAVNTVSGVKTIKSASREGVSSTMVQFELSVSMDRALQSVRDKIAQIRPSFPKTARDPFVDRIDDENAQPVTLLSVTAGKQDLRELSRLTEQVIVKRLQRVAGVGRIVVSGMSSRQIQIRLDPGKMAAHRIGVNEVMRAIQDSNRDMPAGSLRSGPAETVVRLEGRITAPREFGAIIVARRDNANVLLGQLAEVADAEREETSIARSGGLRAVNLSILKVEDANIVEVGEGIRGAVAALKSSLPADVAIGTVYNASDEVKDSLDRVRETIIEGALLTMLVVFLFLHSWRSTIITGLTLPISVLASFIAMRVCGFTLNFMTLMALSLCVGLLIDDAIVVRENIVRHLRMGKGHRQAALDGTREIGLPVLATTLAIVAVFIPVAFMHGVFGRLFLQFGITVAAAVLVSLFVSLTLDPMLSSVWPDPEQGRFRSWPRLARLVAGLERGIARIQLAYARVLRGAMAWPRSTLLVAAALFACNYFLVPRIGTEFIPESDQGHIALQLKTPIGSSLAYTDTKMKQVEAALGQVPGVVLVSATVGTDEGSNMAQMTLALADVRTTRRASQARIEKAIRERLKGIPGIESSVGNGKPIYVALLGPDVDKLGAVVAQVMQKMAQIRGVTEIDTSLTAANPMVVVRVKKQEAADLGLSVRQIGEALQPFVGGDATSTWLAPDGRNYEINVQLPKSGRARLADLATLNIASSYTGPDGAPLMVPLHQVAEFIGSTSPQVIKRQDLQRRVGIYANVEGRPSGDAGADVKAMVAGMKLPPGYRFDVGGKAKEQQESFDAAASALGVAVIFIYLILASQFGSFLQPVAIMVSLPLSMIGVTLTLLATGSTFNVFSVIGFFMLMGLVTKNGILLVDFANRAQRGGMAQHEAVLAAGEARLRPILMTSMAMTFGMLPMAIGTGAGGELLAPMGRAVLGGIVSSTLLTLVVVPVAYGYLDTLGKWALRRLGRAADGLDEAPGTALADQAL
jgi:HAE1 family hydrophobic/amphiphilic exporter-1